MKVQLKRNLKSILITLCAIFLFINKSFGTEFVIINDTLTWTMDRAHSYYWFDSDLPNSPDSWLSPTNYYNGQIYTRYEVLSEATDREFALQFGIWQTMPDTNKHGELMEDQRIMDGPLSIVTSNESPVTMWKNEIGFDFSRLDDTDIWGIILWYVENGRVMFPLSNHYMVAPEYAEEADSIWNIRYLWFPVSVRITVVVVSQGSTFSGWENYVGEKPATPLYSVNYTTIKTNEVVPATDEYSYSSSMIPANSGTGSLLDLTPGQDVYFRTKAAGGNPASDIYHMIVPVRPATPSYTPNYSLEKTAESVPSTVEYSTSESFTTANSGTGVQLNITPGEDLYFRVKATSGSFVSNIYHLDLGTRPVPPQATIDYVNERTNESFSSAVEYSTSSNMAGAVSGGNSTLPLTPGTDLYLRLKATSSSFRSEISHLVVDARLECQAFTIDYVNETTAENITNAYEYATNSNMTSAITGTGTKITLSPAQDLYFRKKATSSSFASQKYLLDVPVRPFLGYSGSNPAYGTSFAAYAILDAGMTGFDLTDISVTNGQARNLRAGNVFDIFPAAVGWVYVKIPANKFNNASFASNQLAINYGGISSGIEEDIKEGLSVYPVPSIDGFIHIQLSDYRNYLIEILSSEGKLIRKYNITGSGIQTFELQDLDKGMYYVRVTCNELQRIRKIILH